MNQVFMRDADPTEVFNNNNDIFSDQNADFDNFKKPNRLNDSSDKSQNDEFFFDAAAKLLLLQTQLLR
jgi:hypothetical protein